MTEEQPAAPDYARGEILLESSDEEDEDDDSDAGDIVVLGGDNSKPINVPRDDDDAEIDLDESKFDDLDAQAAAYNKAHPQKDQEEGQRTHRLAVVNLDWDHVRASHLFKIFSSLVSPTAPAAASTSSLTPVHPDRQKSIRDGSTTIVRGKVSSVRVYPSEFGKGRMAREEKEGPPAEVFKKHHNFEDEDEVNEQNIYEVGGEGDDYDEDALRTYQLERLRCVHVLSCLNLRS